MHEAGCGRGNIVRQQVVRILDGIGYVISKTEVEGQSWSGAEVVLHKEAKRLQADVTRGVAVEKLPAIGISGEEILQRIEDDASAALPGPEVVGGAIAKFSAKAESMLSGSTRNSVRKVLGLRGGREERPAPVSAHRVEIAVSHVNPGKAEQPGVGYAGVDAVGAGIDGMVHRLNRLVETVEADAGIVDPARIRRPRPVHTHYVGPRTRGGEPIWTKNGGVIFDQVCVAVDPARSDHVPVVQVIVRLCHQIVATVCVVEIEVDGRGIRSFQGKARIRQE